MDLALALDVMLVPAVIVRGLEAIGRRAAIERLAETARLVAGLLWL